jgi:DNA gyrase subunit A
MGTRRGVIKKTDLVAFRKPRAGGIIAQGVGDDDSVIAVELTDGKMDILLATRKGMAIRFPETGVRAMGRTASGVRGIKLREGDEVVAMVEIQPNGALMTVCENGYGKRTNLEEYRVQSRAGVGIISIQSSERNGKVVGVACVQHEDELMLITQQGKILRMLTWSIRAIGRATQGVRLIEIEEGDRVVSIARLAEKDAVEVQDEG